MKTALKGSAYAAPVTLAASVPGAAATPPPGPGPCTAPTLTVGSIRLRPDPSSGYCKGATFGGTVLFTLTSARITCAAPNTTNELGIALGPGVNYAFAGSPFFGQVTTDATGTATFTGTDAGAIGDGGVAQLELSNPTLPTSLTIVAALPGAFSSCPAHDHHRLDQDDEPHGGTLRAGADRHFHDHAHERAAWHAVRGYR